MMTKRTQPTDAEMRERALARWEGEGGALAPKAAAGSIDETELRLLARLGAALLDDWASLPPDLQQRVVRRARSLGTPGDHAHVTETLARFLREHRREW
jgi:hypothetical protein